MYVCSCFGITEQQVREHAAAGACTPRQIASESRAGTDCGSCVRRIQGLLGRGGCAGRGAEALAPAVSPAAEAPGTPAAPAVPATPASPAVPGVPAVPRTLFPAAAEVAAEAGVAPPARVPAGLPA